MKYAEGLEIDWSDRELAIIEKGKASEPGSHGENVQHPQGGKRMNPDDPLAKLAREMWGGYR